MINTWILPLMTYEKLTGASTKLNIDKRETNKQKAKQWNPQIETVGWKE